MFCLFQDLRNKCVVEIGIEGRYFFRVRKREKNIATIRLRASMSEFSSRSKMKTAIEIDHHRKILRQIFFRPTPDDLPPKRFDRQIDARGRRYGPCPRS